LLLFAYFFLIGLGLILIDSDERLTNEEFEWVAHALLDETLRVDQVFQLVLQHLDFLFHLMVLHVQFGELIEHHITNGTIVPVEITCSLLERAMTQSEKNNFLIDGFPRNEDNLQGWNKAMGEKVNLQCVLFFHCTQEICTARCLSRGAAGSGRTDDNEESLKKRFVTYEQATMPIIKLFEEQNLVKTLDASMTPQEVYAEVESIIKSFI